MVKSQKVGLALNHQKWSEMGPEWWPGPENRPPGMPRPFPSLWDRSPDQKTTKKVKQFAESDTLAKKLARTRPEHTRLRKAADT